MDENKREGTLNCLGQKTGKSLSELELILSDLGMGIDELSGGYYDLKNRNIILNDNAISIVVNYNRSFDAVLGTSTQFVTDGKKALEADKVRTEIQSGVSDTGDSHGNDGTNDSQNGDKHKINRQGTEEDWFKQGDNLKDDPDFFLKLVAGYPNQQQDKKSSVLRKIGRGLLGATGVLLFALGGAGTYRYFNIHYPGEIEKLFGGTVVTRSMGNQKNYREADDSLFLTSNITDIKTSEAIVPTVAETTLATNVNLPVPVTNTDITGVSDTPEDITATACLGYEIENSTDSRIVEVLDQFQDRLANDDAQTALTITSNILPTKDLGVVASEIVSVARGILNHLTDYQEQCLIDYSQLVSFVDSLKRDNQQLAAGCEQRDEDMLSTLVVQEYNLIAQGQEILAVTEQYVNLLIALEQKAQEISGLNSELTLLKNESELAQNEFLDVGGRLEQKAKLLEQKELSLTRAYDYINQQNAVVEQLDARIKELNKTLSTARNELGSYVMLNTDLSQQIADCKGSTGKLNTDLQQLTTRLKAEQKKSAQHQQNDVVVAQSTFYSRIKKIADTKPADAFVLIEDIIGNYLELSGGSLTIVGNSCEQALTRLYSMMTINLLGAKFDSDTKKYFLEIAKSVC